VIIDFVKFFEARIIGLPLFNRCAASVRVWRRNFCEWKLLFSSAYLCFLTEGGKEPRGFPFASAFSILQYAHVNTGNSLANFYIKTATTQLYQGQCLFLALLHVSAINSNHQGNTWLTYKHHWTAILIKLVTIILIILKYLTCKLIEYSQTKESHEKAYFMQDGFLRPSKFL
jgi:hypothetical protein